MTRRRRRPVEESVSHERWLVSYSDFITLLFAFFVVLFATTYRDNQAIRNLSRGIHDGFQTMGAFSEGGGNEGTYPYPTPGAAGGGQKAASAPDQDDALKGPPPVDPIEIRRELEAALGKEL